MGIEENIVQNQIMDYLKARNIYHHRSNTGRRGKVSYGKKGSGDITGLLPNGRYFSIEAKAPGKKLTPDQEIFRKEIVDNNGVYIWADSIGMFIKKFTALNITSF